MIGTPGANFSINVVNMIQWGIYIIQSHTLDPVWILRLFGRGTFVIKTRRWWDRLIVILRIPLLDKRHVYIETRLCSRLIIYDDLWCCTYPSGLTKLVPGQASFLWDNPDQYSEIVPMNPTRTGRYITITQSENKHWASLIDHTLGCMVSI